MAWAPGSSGRGPGGVGVSSCWPGRKAEGRCAGSESQKVSWGEGGGPSRESCRLPASLCAHGQQLESGEGWRAEGGGALPLSGLT